MCHRRESRRWHIVEQTRLALACLYGPGALPGLVADNEVTTGAFRDLSCALPITVADDQGTCWTLLDKPSSLAIGVSENIATIIAFLDRADPPSIGVTPHERVTVRLVDGFQSAAILIPHDIMVLGMSAGYAHGEDGQVGSYDARGANPEEAHMLS